jgi:hypothetical protein
MSRWPSAPYVTHCDPPDPECQFDLRDGWDWIDEYGGAVLICQTHGLLAPGFAYEIDIPEHGRHFTGTELLAVESQSRR